MGLDMYLYAHTAGPPVEDLNEVEYEDVNWRHPDWEQEEWYQREIVPGRHDQGLPPQRYWYHSSW